jgi:hypothetical protein
LTPAQRQLLDNLRAVVARTTDPAERKELEDKLAFLERDFATEPWRGNPAEDQALLAKARKARFWARFVIATFVVALLGTVAWFWARALQQV